jgi:hypothetical protein
MRTNHFNSDSRVMAVESQTVTNRLDLDALGVVEMSNAEMRETDGGILLEIAVNIVITMAFLAVTSQKLY